MIRRAFTMKLKPGALAEYKQRHDQIWKELVAEIERCGIAQITTFEADPVLFLYSEIRDPDAWNRIWRTKIHDEWAKGFHHLLAFRPDGKVDAGELREIFHLETGAGHTA
jgi:L-rhamnose mutarotase